MAALAPLLAPSDTSIILIQMRPRNTVTWSRTFRGFVTHTLSKSLSSSHLDDFELIFDVRRFHAAVNAAEHYLAPRGLHEEPYELEWHVYHWFKCISEKCSLFQQGFEGE